MYMYQCIKILNVCVCDRSGKFGGQGNSILHVRDMIARKRTQGAAEVDAVGEQELKRTQ